MNQKLVTFELAKLALKLGFTAFGGPAAHIAMLRSEVVERRRWLDDHKFLDLLGATNLIPGPNSTEMIIHIGYLQGGWRGLIIAGTSFILPAMLMVLALAWAYKVYGSTPQAEWLLYGVKPVIIAVILQALWSLSKKAVKGPLTAVVGVGVLGAFFLGWGEIGLLAIGGLVVMLIQNARKIDLLSVPYLLPFPALPSLPLAAGIPVSLPITFLTFLKIGSVLYGSGYVLLAFLRADFVERLGWLTDQQLIDAVAIGQLTPGPVFTTATFIGYLLSDLPGALLATVGIFLPAFFFVAVSNPIIPRLRQSPWAGAFLDGVNVASLGLMAAVTWQLGLAAILDPLTAILGLGSIFLLFRYKINTAWLVLGGAAVGLLRAALS
ncbi:MAG: chromate efflux transporter [Anaerolineales bacterium]|jgi:chromate transporter